MAPQRGRVLALCVLVMLAGQAQVQGGAPVNENTQYMTGNPVGPLYHSSEEILIRLNQMSRGPRGPVRLVPMRGVPEPAALTSCAWQHQFKR
jgi:hypothetical protein